MALPHDVAYWPHERYQSLQQMLAKVHFLWQLKPLVIIVVTYEIRVFFEGAQKEVFSNIF